MVGGDRFPFLTNFYIGSATSTDGLNWKKYNDPTTTQHPFAESDPVMVTGNSGEWDADVLLEGMAIPIQSGFEMYYFGGVTKTVKYQSGLSDMPPAGMVSTGKNTKKIRYTP